MNYDLNWIKHQFDRGATIKYIFFWGHTGKVGHDVGKHVFSQWYDAPFVVDGVEYKTAEHWMMAHKAKVFQDDEIFKKIVEATKPGEVKELGRKVKNFDESVWNEAKYDVVKRGNLHKFSQHEKIKDFLLNTGDRVLVEASPVDSIWGIGLAEDAKQIENPHTWKGLNLLGFALMEVRDALR